MAETAEKLKNINPQDNSIALIDRIMFATFRLDFSQAKVNSPKHTNEQTDQSTTNQAGMLET